MTRLCKLYDHSLHSREIVVPRVISMYQNCVRHNVPDVLIRTLHFNDLYLLLMRLDIAELRQALAAERKSKQKAHGVSIRDITPGEAVKFLKKGG